MLRMRASLPLAARPLLQSAAGRTALKCALPRILLDGSPELWRGVGPLQAEGSLRYSPRAAAALRDAALRYQAARRALALATSVRSRSHWWRRVFRAARRVITLSWTAVPYVVAIPVALGLQPWRPDLEARVWESLAHAVERTGPTFIKLAQWAATREDLFPAQLTQQFVRLQDRNHPHPWRDTEAALDRELGADWRAYLEVDQDPVGSGCIAQVHRGRFRRSAAPGVGGGAAAGDGHGEDVAVKVLHPGMTDLVEADLDILRGLTWALELIPRAEWLSTRELVEEFHHILVDQLDMRIEARNLQRLISHFRDDPKVNFPEPFLYTHDVLVEKFIEGEPIRNFLQSDEKTRLHLSNLGMHTVFKMVFINNFVHADLHPGNILVTDSKDGSKELVILDAGMAVELKPSSHKNMVEILLAFFRSEGYKAGELMVEGARNQCSDVQAFCTAVEDMVHRSHNSPFFDKFGSYVAEVCGMACTHQVKLNEQLVTMAMAIKVLEGLVVGLNPKVEMCHAAIPILLKAQLRHSMGMIRRATSSSSTANDGGSPSPVR